MKILSASQTHQADAYTMAHEPITSVELMERAAHAFVGWFLSHIAPSHSIRIVCGLGNNGGDGLAIARLLHKRHYEIEVYIVWYTDHTSGDCGVNLNRLPPVIPVHHIREMADIPVIRPTDVWVDAIFGSGLNRPVTGLVAAVIQAIHEAAPYVIAVDIPSGLQADAHTAAGEIMHATHTVSFQLPKLAFLLPQNAAFVGTWHLVDIGLHPQALEQAHTPFYYADRKIVKPWLRARQTFSHKGTYGHALLVAGSYGMTGAAILACGGCLRGGVGKLTVQSALNNYTILQLAVPEALFLSDLDDNLAAYSAIGAGPGLGGGLNVLQRLIQLWTKASKVPMVLDADALNALATDKGREWLPKLPPQTILTPHPKEFQRLIQTSWDNDFVKLDMLRDFARTYQVIVCLKGAYTTMALPDGRLFFNSTGNPGMATGGTGDVLTGLITALLAQGYPPDQAAILGVYLHGLAGDEAAKTKGYHCLIASDLIDHLPQAFRSLEV